MGKPRLSEEDFRRAAKRLGCEVAAIKAVAQVESRGAGFYADGFPVILFERHIFRRETKGKYSKLYPNLSGPPGNYGPAGKNQRVKFSQAFALDPIAAMRSCSWGKFQIMGFNHKACGYGSVGEFVDAMKVSEGKQLDAFVEFVINQRIDRPLRDKNWTDFARSYNGKGYAKNKYDTKMAAAYRKFVSETVDDTSSAVASLSSEQQGGNPTQEPSVSAGSTADPHKPVETVVTRTEGDVTVEASKPNEQSVTEKAEVSGGSPYSEVGFWGVIKKDLTVMGVGNFSFQSTAEYLQQAQGWPEWVVLLITKAATLLAIFTVGYFIFRVVHYVVDRWQNAQRVKVEAEAATSITRKDIVWK